MLVNGLLATVYWASLICVGLGVLIWSENRWSGKPIFKDPVIRLFLGICLGFAAFIPIAILGYTFSLPIFITSIFWTVALLITVTRVEVVSETISLLKAIISKRYYLFMFAILGVDYIVSLYLGGYLEGDGISHVARINNFLANGFTIYDSHYPELINVAYNFSLTHPIYAIGAFITSMSAMEIWFGSLAFFRLAMALGVYVVAKIVSNSRLLSSCISAVTIIFMSFNWRFVLYPNQFVFLWLILLVLGLLRVLSSNTFDKFGYFIFITATALIASTHPVFAVGTSCFVLLTIFIHWVQKRGKLPFKTVGLLALSIPILLSPAIYGTLLPVGSTGSLTTSGDTTELFGVTIANPHKSYSAMLLIALIVVLIFAFRIQRSKAFKSVLIATVLTYPIIAFTPAFELVNEFLSARIIRRFRTGTNFISYILTMSTVILISIYWTVSKIIKIEKKKIETLMLLISAVLIVVYVSNAKMYFGTQVRLNERIVELTRRLDRELPDNDEIDKTDLIVASEALSYYIPAITDAGVIKIRDGHSARSSKPEIRKACYEELISEDDSVRRNALGAIMPAYYLLDSNITHLADEPELIPTNTNSTGSIDLYRVDYSTLRLTDSENSACEIIKSGSG